MTLDEANAAAWRIGKERLEVAIAERHSFNFETTLGGTTIARLLAKAHADGLRVRVWYCGLSLKSASGSMPAATTYVRYFRLSTS
jgi:predicted ABC-type ATPase